VCVRVQAGACIVHTLQQGGVHYFRDTELDTLLQASEGATGVSSLRQFPHSNRRTERQPCVNFNFNWCGKIKKYFRLAKVVGGLT
jgi:hypothetical protein